MKKQKAEDKNETVEELKEDIASETQPADEMDVGEGELQKLALELTDSKEQYLRLRAEYDNFRKRSMTEKAAVYNNAASDVIMAILPVADNIDRALEQEGGSAKDIKKGIEMIKNQFIAAFDQFDVKAVGEVGDLFDPNIHNAVSHIEDENVGENVITQVMQKGYLIGDKVIRHAMVQVAN